MSTSGSYFTTAVVKPASAHLVLVGRGVDARAVLRDWAENISVHPIDQIWLSEPGIVGIESIRAFQRDLLLQPIKGDVRLGFLPRADRLSADASHALLKLLEDPPAHAMIVLGAEKEDQLLGTILSRCQRWRISSRKQNPGTKNQADMIREISELRKMSYRERLKLAETWAKEDNWQDRLSDIIAGCRELFLRGDFDSDKIAQLLRWQNMQNTNVTPRLLLDNVLLSLGKETA